MKMKYLAFAAALVFSAPAYAAALNAGATFPGDNVQSGLAATLSAGYYTLSTTITSVFSGFGFAGVSTSVVDSLDHVIASIPGGTSSGAKLFSSSLNFNVTSPGLYKIVFEGGSVGGITTASASVNAVAVPGPEAGAGIGALAMAGLGALAYRRKRLAA